MTSKTLETVIVAVIVIAIAVSVYSQLPNVLSGLLEKAAKVERVK